MSRCIRIFGLSLCALLISLLPCRAAELALEAVLGGKSVPLSITLKEVPAEWRIFSAEHGSGGLLEARMMAAMMGHDQAPPQLSTRTDYLTGGQTVTCGEVTFLVAYAFPGLASSLTNALMAMDGNEPNFDDAELFKPLTGDTALSLSLLNLATLGDLVEIRPFNMKEVLEKNETMRQFFESARQKARQSTSLNNLRQLGIAVQMWIQDNNEKFPDMRTTEKLRDQLKAYDGNDELWRSPLTKEFYQPNTALSNKALGDIANPAEMVMLYEATPWGDGLRCVAYVDGHVSVESKERWQEAKKASGIP